MNSGSCLLESSTLNALLIKHFDPTFQISALNSCAGSYSYLFVVIRGIHLPRCESGVQLAHHNSPCCGHVYRIRLNVFPLAA